MSHAIFFTDNCFSVILQFTKNILHRQNLYSGVDHFLTQKVYYKEEEDKQFKRKYKLIKNGLKIVHIPKLLVKEKTVLHIIRVHLEVKLLLKLGFDF